MPQWDSKFAPPERPLAQEPRWPALIAILGVGAGDGVLDRSRDLAPQGRPGCRASVGLRGFERGYLGDGALAGFADRGIDHAHGNRPAVAGVRGVTMDQQPADFR